MPDSSEPVSKSKVVSMAGDNSQLAAALGALCKYANWRKITALLSTSDGSYYASLMQATQTIQSKFNVTVNFAHFDCGKNLDVQKSVEFIRYSSRSKAIVKSFHI